MINEIQETLKEVSQKGFDKKLIDSVLHLIELNSKLGKVNQGVNLF